MASAKPELTRDGTMQVTAKEGIALLKAAGKDTLLEMQGLKDPEEPKESVEEGKECLDQDAGKSTDSDADMSNGDENNVDDKPSVPRDAVAEATAKVDEEDDDVEEEDEAPVAKKPKIAKGTTMVNTAKEAKGLLGDNAPDADAQTRGQQKKIVEIQSEKPKKAKLSKSSTMAVTAKEGAELLGDAELGDTRTETKSKQRGKASGSVKRLSTIQKTMEEAKVLLAGETVGEGRRTRSASKPQPLKKAGTMQATAKEGKEFLKRSKKLKKAAEKEESEPEEEVEEATEEA